ncbi:MAG: ATP-dependent zinc metalloprotease FtsH [bacterium]
MDKKDKPMLSTKSKWGFVIWTILFLFLFIYLLRGFGSPPEAVKISYTKFKQEIKKGRISEITFKDNIIIGNFKEPTEVDSKDLDGNGKLIKYQFFKTTKLPVEDPELLPDLEKNKVVIKAEAGERTWMTTLLIGLLPWLLIIGFFIYSSRKLEENMTGGKGGPFGIGKSKAKLYAKSNSTNVSFQNVAGLANAKKELLEVVDFLKAPQKYQALGGELPKGILLVGPPGTGKTLMARAAAGEANVPFFSISGSEFIEIFVGVGAARVRDMFELAKRESPSIIFIDEIDSIGRARGTGLGGGHDEREQTLNQILSEMDGFSPHHSVVVMAATNRPDVLDPALVRPGRFDRQITLELPQKKARKEILQLHTRHIPMDKDINLGIVADRTVGFSGAELKNLVNEAALMAARKNKKQVETEDFDQARDKVIMGLEREDLISEEEKKIIAYHEAGHALMAKLLPNTDTIKKVSIIPRGQSLGATEQIPGEDRHNFSRTYLLNRISIMLGGRVAEKIVFKDITSGASDDLKKITQLVKHMVRQWGMSEKIGPVVFQTGETHPFLGRELAEPKDFSEYTAKLIDEEVRRIIQEGERRTEDVLNSNNDKLDIIAKGLLEHESLSNEEIDQLLMKVSSIIQ